MNCEFCQSPVHIWFQCPKKPDGWKPARLAKKSTAARKDVRFSPSLESTDGAKSGIDDAPDTPSDLAGTQALPVDTPKRGRPSTGFDKRAYNKQYMADRRAGKR